MHKGVRQKSSAGGYRDCEDTLATCRNTTHCLKIVTRNFTK